VACNFWPCPSAAALPQIIACNRDYPTGTKKDKAETGVAKIVAPSDKLG
jgi:hypothetical protein